MIARYLRYIRNRIMTQPKKNIITIVGTTGVGKSQFSIDLAKAIDGEVVNADSMQVYKGLDIITNKHPVDERDGVQHHVMDHIDWNQEYFIHRFAKEARIAIEDIHLRGKTPIVVGGTHYYLLTVLFKNKTIGDKSETSQPDSLSSEQAEVLDGPVEEIFARLKELDPLIADKFHPQDRRKLRRALEIYYTTGKKPSDIYRDQKLEEMEDTSLKYNTLLFWVYSDPEVLKQRLDERVDKMMQLGAFTEIKDMFHQYQQLHPVPECTSGIWQVIGFKEFLPWLTSGQADNSLFEDGVERMKIRTRQYAKYQVKWIKKLLAVELMKEARFNYKYGGKLYVLDSTNMQHWHNQVSQTGINIARQFIEGGPHAVTAPQAPANLLQLIPSSTSVAQLKSNKILGSESNWKHYECTICKDKEGKNLVAVGTDSWHIHLQSNRHKKQKHYLQKKRKMDSSIAHFKRPTTARQPPV